jgi:hypothetical protein
MKPIDKLRKSLGYLDHLEAGLQAKLDEVSFGWKDKLEKVRNVQTLVKNSIKDIEIMQGRLNAYDKIISKDLKELNKIKGDTHGKTK